MTPLSDALARLDSHDVLALVIICVLIAAVFAVYCIVRGFGKL